MRNLIYALLFSLIILTNCKKDDLLSSSANKFGNYIIESSDGGFIITGRASPGDVNPEVVLLKIDNQGNQEWYKLFGTEHVSDGGYTVVELPSKEIAILSMQSVYVEALNSEQNSLHLLKTDHNGNKEVEQIISSNNYVSGLFAHMVLTQDNGYLIAVNRQRTGSRATHGLTRSHNQRDIQPSRVSFP